MQCEYCDSKATVFFTQIIDGESTKSCLCDECAIKHGVTDPEGFLLGDMLPPTKTQPSPPKNDDSTGNAPDAPPPRKSSDICPGCGFAFDDLKKTGRLGCSRCYTFFRQEILRNLSSMHKGTHHTGRVPKGMLEAFEKRQRLEELNLQMEDAIRTEDYEKAATLRDQIRRLNEEEPPPPPTP